MDVQSKSIRWMTAANALHFASYECSRIGTMVLITSQRNGFPNASAVSLATGFVSPFSMLLLWTYSHVFDIYGPRKSLLYSTLFIATIIAIVCAVLTVIDPWMDDSINQNNNQQESSQTYNTLLIISRTVLFSLYVIKNSFVTLLYSQHWSFITSVMNTAEVGATWFAPIAGVASITATVSAYGMSHPYIQQQLGMSLHRMLALAAILLVACAYCSDQAYSIAEMNGFVPTDKKTVSNNPTKEIKKDKLLITNQLHQQKSSLVQRAIILFRRVPILQGLCLEVLICQSVSSILSYLFVSTTKKILYYDDNKRARYTGSVYAAINFGSGLLEFLVLPLTLKRIDSRRLWLFMPSIMLLLVIWIFHASTRQNLTLKLLSVTVSFSAKKIIEYALHGVTTELVYTSLDFESRFFGKEIVGLFANRLGKSGTAIGLALVSMKLDSSLFEDVVAPLVLIILTTIWLAASYNIIHLLRDSNKTIKIE